MRSPPDNVLYPLRNSGVWVCSIQDRMRPCQVGLLRLKHGIVFYGVLKFFVGLRAFFTVDEVFFLWQVGALIHMRGFHGGARGT